MADHNETSRRDFLTTSAKLAGLAGLASATGCAAIKAGPALHVAAGPTPKTIKPDQPIRVGLVGVGNRQYHILSQLFNAPDFKNFNIKFVATADPSVANTKKVLALIKDKTGQTPEAFHGEEDWKKVIARDDVDALQLATYPVQHGEMYLACFAAGKHFYGEKPMCASVPEANALVEAQKKNPGVTGIIGFQRRASVRYQEAMKRIHSGEFGRLIEARAAWNLASGPLGLPDQGTMVWFGRKRLSGDWMIEQACHTWDVLNWVTNGEMPIAATAIGQRGLFKDLDPERDVTDYYVAHLEYKSGFMVNYSHSWVCPHKDEGRFMGVYERVVCKTAGLALDEGKIFWRDPKLEPAAVPGAGEPDMTRDSLANLYRCLRAGTKPPSGVENGRLATLVGLLVRTAVYEQRRVTMKEIAG